MNYFIIVLIVILVIIYYTNFLSKENFDPNINQNYEPLNYNTRKQNCNELTYTPNKCNVNTVIPSNKIVCNKSLSPITNNDKYNEKTCQNSDKNPNVSLKYDFDLLSSFNNAQLDNISNTSKNEKKYQNYSEELKTDIRSLNSIENDLYSE